MNINSQETPNFDPVGAARDMAWKDVGEIVNRVYEKECPYVGRHVRIDKGRKHKGECGIVTWHGRDRFDRDYGRYGNAMSDAIHDARGRDGFRVRIKLDSGENVFINADYITII
jgi:hypothetical protein